MSENIPKAKLKLVSWGLSVNSAYRDHAVLLGESREPLCSVTFSSYFLLVNWLWSSEHVSLIQAGRQSHPGKSLLHSEAIQGPGLSTWTLGLERREKILSRERDAICQ